VEIEWRFHLYPHREPRLTVLGPHNGWSMSWGRKPRDLVNLTVSSRLLTIILAKNGRMWVRVGRNAAAVVVDQTTGEAKRITFSEKEVRIEFLGVKVAVDVEVPGHGTIFSATFVTPVPAGWQPSSTPGLTRSAYDIEALLQMMGTKVSAGDDPTRARDALITLLAHTFHRNAEALGGDYEKEFQGLWDLGKEIMGDQTTVPKRDQRVRYSKAKQLAITRGKDGKPRLAEFLARTEADVSAEESDAARDFIQRTVRPDQDRWVELRERWLDGRS
jgi:hypothetical protein